MKHRSAIFDVSQIHHENSAKEKITAAKPTINQRRHTCLEYTVSKGDRFKISCFSFSFFSFSPFALLVLSLGKTKAAMVATWLELRSGLTRARSAPFCERRKTTHTHTRAQAQNRQAPNNAQRKKRKADTQRSKEPESAKHERKALRTIVEC